MPPKPKGHRWILDGDGFVAVTPRDGWCPGREMKHSNMRNEHWLIQCGACGVVHCIECSGGTPYDSPCER